MEKEFIVKGGNKLMGEVHVSGSKNAALPIIAATLTRPGVYKLHNVPDISDVRTLIDILNTLKAKTTYKNETLTVDSRNIENMYLGRDIVGKIRASILLLGPLLSRFGEVKISFPGGCFIGKRPLDAHLTAFEQIGYKVLQQDEDIIIYGNRNENKSIILNEISVTASENILTYLSGENIETTVHLASMEPHVEDLCDFLEKQGVKFSGKGTHNVTIKGNTKFKQVEHSITPDYLEVGTFACAAAATKGDVKIYNVIHDHLYSLYNHFNDIGLNYELGDNFLHIKPTEKLKPLAKLRTAVHPSFATDLQAPFGVLLTQCDGISKIYETLFEGRLTYLIELEKMGAQIELLNPHQAMIIGPRKLRGTSVASADLRAGAAMVIAGLIAEGETRISNIHYIHRGYSNLIEKMNKLGGDIKSV